MRKTTITLAVVFAAIGLAAANLTAVDPASQPKYKDPSLSVEERVEDLIGRMTLAEKAAQLRSIWSADSLAFDKEGNFTGTADTSAMRYGIGSFTPSGLWNRWDIRDRVRCMNGLQRHMLEKTRLGIPVMSFAESLHGLLLPGATHFPQAIALGCTWDTTLVEQVFRAAALEARSAGVTQVLAPVCDLARDPRWGRTEECYGEDPYHVSRMAAAAVFGFQGRGGTIDGRHVAVTLKHFAGHGQSEGGRNIAPVNLPERLFRETHLVPFEIAVRRAAARSIMASYNEWDGVPNHVNRKLLSDILRNEWGFKGYVMSDGGGMDVTWGIHSAAADAAESGALSLTAGIDHDLVSSGCFDGLEGQVKRGIVPEEAVTNAAKNVLRVKFDCGLFDNPMVDPDLNGKAVNCAEHRALARKAAAEAMVLLKNSGRTLPFDSTRIKTLAVIGPNAAGIHLGGYSSTPMRGVSVLEGMMEFAKGRFEVLYSEGCRLTLNPDCDWSVDGNPVLNDPQSDAGMIDEAVKTARKSDAVVLVIGENELINREAWSETHLGDRDDLGLAGMQNELAKAVIKTGKPTVVLLINGRPITINELQEEASAIVECWYLGQETGRAVADVIFGKVNPGGKLTVTFPRSAGQLPCYYDRMPSRFRGYVLADSSPLYPFGFGLSYTAFEYQNLKITPDAMTADGRAVVSVEVTNTGSRAGDEIVQLYVRDVVSLPTRPVKELKDFSRITLRPGETRTVSFTIGREKLEAIGMDMKRTVQPGDFEIMAGGNSEDVLKTVLRVR